MNIECKKPNYCVENSKTYKLCDYKKKNEKRNTDQMLQNGIFSKKKLILGISLFFSFSEPYAHHN